MAATLAVYLEVLIFHCFTYHGTALQFMLILIRNIIVYQVYSIFILAMNRLDTSIYISTRFICIRKWVNGYISTKLSSACIELLC